MLIGLMADSHDRVPAIRELLERLTERGAGMVLHAGDYCSPFSLAPFLELSIPFAGVFGRNDGDREGHAHASRRRPPRRSGRCDNARRSAASGARVAQPQVEGARARGSPATGV